DGLLGILDGILDEQDLDDVVLLHARARVTPPRWTDAGGGIRHRCNACGRTMPCTDMPAVDYFTQCAVSAPRLTRAAWPRPRPPRAPGAAPGSPADVHARRRRVGAR